MFVTRKFYRALHISMVQLARRQRPRKANPGMAYQLEGMDVHKDDEVYNDLGELESDFMQVHKTQRDYEREQQQQRELIRRLIIKQKYFPEPVLPSLLSYAEKEKIRLLHNQAPDEWPAEKLAESFPATVDIIRKVLRSQWRARTVQRVKAHDKAVLHNWELLGKDANFAAQFPIELREHLKKFTARKSSNIRATANKFKPPAPLPRPESTEFSSIITSCEKYKLIESSTQQQQELVEEKLAPKAISNENLEAETYIFEKIKDKRQMRLEELKKYKLQTNLPLEIDASTANAVEKPEAGKKDNEFDHYLQKYEENEIIISKEDAQRYDMTPFKERIYIPRKLRKSGALYRVNDCFYADDGEFLFSVPGMTGRSKQTKQ